MCARGRVTQNNTACLRHVFYLDDLTGFLGPWLNIDYFNPHYAEQGEIYIFEDNGGWSGHALLSKFIPLLSSSCS